MTSFHGVFKSGNTAVITGGASGVGLALAKKCVGYEMNVVICDINFENLDRAVEALKKDGKGKVEGVIADVGVVEDYSKVKKAVEENFNGELFPLI